MEGIFKCITSGCVVCIGALFGRQDEWLLALVIIVVIDYLTGISKAYILGKLNSRVGLKGVLKKVMYFAVVAVASIIDDLLNAQGAVRLAAIGLLIGNESLSILENCTEAGIPVPKVLVRALDKLKHYDNIDDIDDKNGGK